MVYRMEHVITSNNNLYEILVACTLEYVKLNNRYIIIVVVYARIGGDRQAIALSLSAATRWHFSAI